MAVSEGDNGKQGSPIAKLLPILTRFLLMFDNKLFYYFSLLNFWTWLLSSAGLLVDGLINPSSEFWLKYGVLLFPGIFFNGYMCICLTSFTKWKELKECFELELPWDLSKMSPTLSNDLQELCKQVERMFLVLYTVLCLSGAAAFTQQLPVLVEYIYSEVPYMEHFNTPFDRLLLIVWIFISTEFMSTVMIIGMYYSFSLAFMTRIQIIIFMDLVKNFQRSITDDNSYIKAHLKFLIKRHQDILRIHILTRKEWFFPHLIVTICYFVVLIFSILTVFSPYYGYLPSIINTSTAIILLAYFSHQGQIIQDLNEEVNTSLYDLNWYEWDRFNRKMFLMFFLNSSIKVQTEVSSFARINHEYFLRNVNILYAMVNLGATVFNR